MQRDGADAIGEEGAWDNAAPEFLDQHHEVEKAHADAAELLGHHEAHPALFGHLAPDFRQVAGIVFFHVAHVGLAALLLQEVTREVA